MNQDKSQIAKMRKVQDVNFFSGGFIEFLVPLIDDVNFKVSLTSLNMMTKLFVLDVVNLKDGELMQLIQKLITKLTDSKVVIR